MQRRQECIKEDRGNLAEEYSTNELSLQNGVRNGDGSVNKKIFPR